jgi:hypothetical protein
MQLLENLLYFVIWAGIIFLVMRTAAVRTSWGMVITTERRALMITAIATCVGCPRIALSIRFVA